MRRIHSDEIELKAIWINNDASASSGVTYIYNDALDDQKLKIGRDVTLGDSVALSIDRNGVISGSFIGTFSGTDAGEVWTRSGNDIYYNTGDVGIGTTNPFTYPNYTTLSINHATNGGVISFQQAGVEKAQIYSYTDDLKIKADDDIDFYVDAPGDNLNILSLDGGTKTVNIKPGQDANIALRVNGTDTTSEYLSLGIYEGIPTITAGFQNVGSASLAFKTSNDTSHEAERMRIDVSGNVGIGTTTPLVNLEVNYENGATNLSASLNSSGSHHGLLIHNDLDGTDDVFSNLDFTAGTTSTGRIALVDSPFEIETVVTSLASPRDVKVDSLGVATAGVPKIYYSDSSQNKIVQASLDGSLKDNLYTGLGDPGGIALDPTAGKIYWTDFHGSHDNIRVGDMDGSGASSIVLSGLNGPMGIAIDAANSHLYFCDNGDNVIKRVDTVGTNETTLISGGDPNYIALDLINTPNKMYWTDFDADEIKRADLDGTNPETLVELDPGSPRGISLDISAGKMYWVDEGLDTMSRANMDGSDVETLLTGLNFTTGMDIDTVQKTIYWCDLTDNDIHRIYYQKGEFSFNPGAGEKMRISHRGVEIPVVDGNVVISGDDVVLRLGMDREQGLSNFSSRIEFVEDISSQGTAMNYGGFIHYDGDAVDPDFGAIYLGVRDNSITDTNVVTISRKADAGALIIGPQGTSTQGLTSSALPQDAGSNALRYDTTTGFITYQTSTRKTKENIRDLMTGSGVPETKGMDLLKQLRPVMYDQKGSNRTDIMGLVAEEVGDIHSSLVHYTPDMKFDDAGQIMRNADKTPILESENLVPINFDDRALLAQLIISAQQLDTRIKTIEDEVFDTTAPTITLSGKPDAVSTNKNPAFTFSANEAATFEVFLTGWKSWQAAVSPKTFSNLTSGTRTFSVRATDLKGNVSAPTTYTWEIDLTNNTLATFGYPDWTGAIQNPTTNSSFSSPDHTTQGNMAYPSWTGTIQNPAISSNFGTVAHSLNNLFGEKHWSGTISNPATTSNFSKPSHSIGANFNANGKLGW